MDVFDIYAILCKKITQSSGGITGITVGADGSSIDITYGAGGKDNVPFPNQLTQAQRQLVAKFSVDASGKLLFDGKEISSSGDMTIQDGSITASKLADDAGDGLIGEGRYSANLFNKANVVNDKYLVENGTETSEANFSYGTDYIPIDMTKTYTFTGCYGKNHQGVLYDEDKAYVGIIYKDKCTGTAGKSLVCDFSKLNKPTAKYIRLNTTTNKLDLYMFVQADSYPTEYIPFKYTPGGLKSSKLQSAIETIVGNKSSSLEGITIGETVNVNGNDQLIAIGTNTPKDTSLPAVAIGYGALQNNMTTGSDDTGRFNVAVGSSTLNVNTTGNHNTAIGYQAMRRNTTGSGNTGIGEDACIANTTGNGNTGVGRYTLFTNSVGNDNVAVGLNASYLLESSKNTAVGVSAGRSNVTGVGNTYLGYYANGNDAITNATAIGNQAYVKESDAIQLGNSDVKNVYTWGNIQIQRNGAGIILLSPNGTKCKLTVSNDGKLLFDGKELADELVKMEAAGDAHYLADLLDKQTIVNDNNKLKVKKLDGQNVTIAEINYLKGLTMNVMDLVNAFANGGVKVHNTPVATYADLTTLDRSKFIDGISYIVYVLADETHAGAKTTYLCDKTSSTYFGNADSQRNFTTNPIDLANEVTGKLPVKNIDVDSLWALLTVDDTYKTLTTTNNAFGTHGAKAMYDELVAGIGAKANQTDFDTHKDDTTIHISSDERTKWNDTADKVNGEDLVKKADIKTTTLDESSTNDDIYGGKAIYDAIKANCVGKETVLYDGATTATGTYTLADDVNNYDFILINYSSVGGAYVQSVTMSKIEISKCIDEPHKFMCVHGNADNGEYTAGYFNGNKLIICTYIKQVISSIVGYKFGQVTVQNTIANPSPAASYSTDEQLTGGTWIDGKPIYRKVISLNCPNCARDGSFADAATDVSSLNIDYMMFKNVNLIMGNDIIVPYNSFNPDEASKFGGMIWYNQINKSIYTRHSRTDFNNRPITAVIEYTKTTDA